MKELTKKREELLVKAMLSFYPAWQRPLIKLLAWIMSWDKPKVKW